MPTLMPSSRARWTAISESNTAGDEIRVSSYGQSWWYKNNGVKFRIRKTGAYAITHSNAKWI